MSPDFLILYRKMLLIREAEQLIQRHYNSNVMKTPMHLAVGAEAIPCGVLPHFKKRRVFGTYRNHHWYLETTEDLAGFFLELLGKQSAPSQGRAGSMHLCNPDKGMILTSAVVGTTIPIALGDSWAGQRMSQPEQTIVFFGDGATEEGVFWESLNFSKIKNIPLLFVCEDNDLAIHSNKSQRQAYELENVVKVFGIPYYRADACSVENVFEVGKLAAHSLKSGPAFLHLDYFRALEHVGIADDFHFKYRVKPDDISTIKDPVWNCEQKLAGLGYSLESILEIRDAVRVNVAKVFESCLLAPDSDPALVDEFVEKGFSP